MSPEAISSEMLLEDVPGPLTAWPETLDDKAAVALVLTTHPRDSAQYPIADP